MNLFAYLDPGAGSIIIQVLIAALVGAGFYFRHLVVAPVQGVWRRISGQKNDASHG